ASRCAHVVEYVDISLQHDPATAVLYTFPYTTLFRSAAVWVSGQICGHGSVSVMTPQLCCVLSEHGVDADTPIRQLQVKSCTQLRSEEHTSELQSRENLVCRLLLEKKKQRSDETYEYK